MHRTRVFLLAIGLIAFSGCDDLNPFDPDDDGPPDPTPNSISLQRIGGYEGGGLGAAEITAYDPGSRRLFVVNGALGTVDVLDLSNPAAPVSVGVLNVTQHGKGVNSVAIHEGLVALAVEGNVKTDAGKVVLYRAENLSQVGSAVVGALPDMVTFTPDGRYVVVANEGEPNDQYTVDPEGSISIVDVRNPGQPTVRTAGFGAYNGQEASLRAQGIRIYGPGASAAKDLEPEYIAISEDGTRAYVTVQEANALAIVDIASATVSSLVPFGYKDHMLAGNGLDVSDRDNAVNIRNWPVKGMYQPDAIAAYTVGGQTYLITANEGDAREWGTFIEERRVADLQLNPAVFTDAVCGGPCAAASRLGRLTVTSMLGLNAQTGRYDALYVLGGRSISIWSATGAQVWDSGDQLEQRTKDLPMAAFNASHDNNSLDNRSDNKGPEPEGVVLGRMGEKTFAFVGLERVGGVMVYDVSNPSSPSYVTYVNTRSGETGDRGPEGLVFIRAADSPIEKPLLVVGNEISGTTAVYEILLQ